MPSLSDDEILVGIMHLVAMISSEGRDGHMGVWPPDNPGAVHRFPIRVWEFADGVFVTAARQPNEHLVGSKVVSVDGVPIDQVFRRLDPVVPRDNASNLRDARTVFLTSAEVLDGHRYRRRPAYDDARGPVPRRHAANGHHRCGRRRDLRGLGRRLGAAPAHRARICSSFVTRRDAFWLEYLSSSRTLYVQYNIVHEHSSQAVNEIERAMRGHPVDRLVLDLRNNGGGEAGGYRDLLRFLAGPEIDRPGRLFVLIGRLTFSAGVEPGRPPRAGGWRNVDVHRRGFRRRARTSGQTPTPSRSPTRGSAS